jgi:NAD(P)-dependent dehydrogenase (short-subunit alcohol dehydrogenase family)
MADRRFEGRVAVVTGGAGGIGSATASRLVADGAHVVLVDTDMSGLTRVAAELSGAGSVTTITADVTDESGVTGYVARVVDERGRLDLFFNNAGIEGRLAPLTDIRMEDFDRVMAVNVRGVFLGLREVMRQMKRQPEGGAIVNTSSMGGLKAGPEFSPYVASKHAVVGLTRCAALEGAPHRIRVNAVAPGQIATRMTRSLARQRSPEDPDRAMAARAAQIPLGRYGTAGEVANLVCWLLSDEATYVTGSIHSVDAGLTA